MMNTNTKPANSLGQRNDDEGSGKVNYNVDLKSFYDQLAQDSSARGFKILVVPSVSDTAPLSDKRRNSAPAVVNGATCKMLSEKIEPRRRQEPRQSCPPSQPQRRFSSDDDCLLLDTIFDEKLESILDEVEDIICGEDKDEQP